jgi:hypothetical protein
MSTHRHDRARHPRRPLLASAALACFLAAYGAGAAAQITNGGGSERQESRQSDSTSRADPSGTTLHESQAPQSKDAAKGRSATAGKNHQPEGSGGFNNGLYGTGAGNNK